MRRIVVGVFDQPENARAAIAALAREGFAPEHIHVAQSRPHATAAVIAAPAVDDHGVLGLLRTFFAEVFGVDHDLRPMAAVVDRGGVVVRVDMQDTALAPRAELALVTAGAVDITHRDAD